MFNISWSPEKYKKAAVIANVALRGMLARLAWMTIKPEVIVDVGAKTGEGSVALQKHYPDAKVIAIDMAESMVEYTRNFITTQHAAYENLPFANNSVDVIFANLVLPLHPDVPLLLQEWQRVLKPNGLLMLSALGPDTCKELRADVNAEEMAQTVDMHNVGDALVQAGFADPVLDVDYCTLTYKNKTQLLLDLHDSGLLNADIKLENMPEIFHPEFELTFELVYAHAWTPNQAQQKAQDGTVYVSVASLRGGRG